MNAFDASSGVSPAPRFDVAVIGLGPVGAIAAQLLASQGISVLAVDAQLRPYDKPRAIALDHESLRVLQKLGIAQSPAFRLGDYKASEYRNGSGALLRRIKPAPEPHLLGWPPSATFVQPQLEQLLRERLVVQTEIAVEVGARLTAFREVENGVELEFKGRGSGDSGDLWQATCGYLLACDGASSMVRDSLAMKVDDLEFDEPWLVVDVHVSDAANLPETTVQFCDPRRPATFIAGPGNLRRWEIMLLPGEDPTEMVKEEMVWKLLSPWLTPQHGEVWRAAAYRFHALVSAEWRRGRIFLAGDAAHQTPPFMGQGLNQGIRDALNLSWKLAEVIRHGAGDALLDTYEIERRPNAREVIELTKSLGELICEQDPVKAALRDTRLLAEVAAGKGEFVRQDMLPPLRNGCLWFGAQGNGESAVGKAFPQPWVREQGVKRRLDDVVASRFLLVSAGAAELGAEEARVARSLDVALLSISSGPPPAGWRQVDDREGLIAAWLARSGAEFMLVRPDHVVFAQGETARGIPAALAHLEGAIRCDARGDAADHRKPQA